MSKKYVGQVMYKNYMSNVDIFQGFDRTKAITQADVCLPSEGLNLWPQFDEAVRARILQQYPSVKFILLKRDPKKLVSSIKRWSDMFFRFVASDIPGLPAWRGLKDEELLTWIDSHYYSIEKQYADSDNFISIDLTEDDSFERFLEFSGLKNDAQVAGIEEWPFINSREAASANLLEFDSSTYWLAKDFSDEVKRNRAMKVKFDVVVGKNNKELKEFKKRIDHLNQQLEAKGVELEKVVGERDARANEKGEVQMEVEELRKQLEAKGVELEKVVGERDARAREKGEAQQAVEELMKQLEAKGVELEKVVGERDARANEKGEVQMEVEELKKQLEAKGVELEKVVGERDARAKEKGEAQQQLTELRKQSEQASVLLAEQRSAAKDASDEAELTLLQLHQVQEELEHYFLQSRSKDDVLRKHQIQQQRMKRLMSKALVVSR